MSDPWRRIESIGLVAGILLLAIAYALHPARGREAGQLADRFYRPLRASGISPDGSHVIRHVREGSYTDWTFLVAREAYARWRVRDIAPEALDALYGRWQSGLWSEPERGALEAAFEETEAGWLAIRDASGRLELDADWGIRLVIADGTQTGPELTGETMTFTLPEKTSFASLYLDPPLETPTARLGDCLVFEAEGLSSLPKLYWSTNHLPVSSWRVVTAREPEPGLYLFDLSREPAWRHPDVQAGRLRIDVERGDSQSGFRVIRFAGWDEGETR